MSFCPSLSEVRPPSKRCLPGRTEASPAGIDEGRFIAGAGGGLPSTGNSTALFAQQVQSKEPRSLQISSAAISSRMAGLTGRNCAQEGLRIRVNHDGHLLSRDELDRGDMAMTTRTSPVPKSARPAYEAIIALTDAFCRDHLNNEYRELAHDVAAALCRKRPSPVTSGQARSWA